MESSRIPDAPLELKMVSVRLTMGGWHWGMILAISDLVPRFHVFKDDLVDNVEDWLQNEVMHWMDMVIVMSLTACDGTPIVDALSGEQKTMNIRFCDLINIKAQAKA